MQRPHFVQRSVKKLLQGVTDVIMAPIFGQNIQNPYKNRHILSCMYVT